MRDDFTRFYAILLDSFQGNEQHNRGKKVGAHVPIKKSPHTADKRLLTNFQSLKVMKNETKQKDFSSIMRYIRVFLDYDVENFHFTLIFLY